MTMHTARNRGEIWLRALLYAPLVVLALAPLAGNGGHAALPFDTLYGGDSKSHLGFWMLLGFAGMAVYGISVLLFYAMVFINGPRAVAATLRRPAILLLAVGAGAAALHQYVRLDMQDQIRRAQASVEQIGPEQWRALSCGRSQYVCVDWEGSLGRAQIKVYAGDRTAASAQLRSWESARAAGEPLLVAWGVTPRKWIAVRSAAAGKLEFANPR
jgi:hypothetical protein